MRHPFIDAQILLVADSALPGANATEDQLHAGGFRRVTRTGESSVIGLFAATTPDLVILDVHGEADGGLCALERLVARFSDDRHALILVVGPGDCAGFGTRALELGASDVVFADTPAGEFVLRVRNLLRVHYALLDQEGIQRRQAKQRESERDSLEEDAIERFRLLLKLRGVTSHAEMERIGEISERLAAAMGAPASVSRLYRVAAPLRDIGRLAVAAGEREQWSHAAAGHRVLRGSDLPALRLAAQMAKLHHERWDGSGCFGLRAFDIPLPGRIVAVVGAFVELTATEPPGREAIEAALHEVSQKAGEWYDPRIVETLRNLSHQPSPPVSGCLRLVRQAA